jgi:hypothetical protein
MTSERTMTPDPRLERRLAAGRAAIGTHDTPATTAHPVVTDAMIDAAPDLFKALTNYLADADAGHVSVDTDNTARQALAKARGEVA